MLAFLFFLALYGLGAVLMVMFIKADESEGGELDPTSPPELVAALFWPLIVAAVVVSELWDDRNPPGDDGDDDGDSLEARPA